MGGAVLNAVRHLSSLIAGIFRAHAESELDLIDGADETPIEHDEPDLPALTIDANGLLQGEGVEHILTKRGGYKWRTKSGQSAGFLSHWSATSHGTARSMVKRTQGGTGSSVHLWIEHDGTIFQQVPFSRGAGHAGGKTSAKLRDLGGAIVRDASSKYSANSFLVGCEVVCVGEVRRVLKESGRWVRAAPESVKAIWMGWPYGKDGKKGPIVKAEQVVSMMDKGRKRYYQAFTEQQLAAIERVLAAGREAFRWTRGDCTWGHCDVDPTRKSDPGEYYRRMQLPAILDRVFGAA